MEVNGEKRKEQKARNATEESEKGRNAACICKNKYIGGLNICFLLKGMYEEEEEREGEEEEEEEEKNRTRERKKAYEKKSGIYLTESKLTDLLLLWPQEGGREREKKGRAECWGMKLG